MKINLSLIVWILALSMMVFTVSAQETADKRISVLDSRNAYFKQEYVLACNQELIKLDYLASTEDEAAQQEITVEKTLGYQLTLNQQGEGYLQLAITKWNEKLIMFHNKDIKLEIPGGDVTGSLIENQHCFGQDKWITHFNTHEWGSYTLKLTGKPNQNVELSIIKEIAR
ncbi:hypothetical protein C9J48_09450 [Photobacterium profundum]|uniref:Orphan protein n=1 Tax=Photobacterium profundum 3TCK TaxID=314280 RepID=Q1YWH4_9GAMM|nr:hypothetical protein [Photobacterium profundum]EAS40628.1 hypothetical protein P3TCK_10263 [Photobacterium profundum 3TCK]PSV62205.1 hypothetical protein C9J48_09450 [Photobacterium profundum]